MYVCMYVCTYNPYASFEARFFFLRIFEYFIGIYFPISALVRARKIFSTSFFRFHFFFSFASAQLNVHFVSVHTLRRNHTTTYCCLRNGFRTFAYQLYRYYFFRFFFLFFFIFLNTNNVIEGIELPVSPQATSARENKNVFALQIQLVV